MEKQDSGLISIAGSANAFRAALDGLAGVSYCEACHYPLPKDGSPCEICREKAQELAEAKENQKRWDIERLGGILAYRDFTVERYDSLQAMKKCAGYPDKGLFLWGAAGVGKTHLATALVRQHPQGAVYKPQEILRRFRGHKTKEEEEKLLQSFIYNPALVIDDIGTEKRTDFGYSVIYEILDGRMMACVGGLVITSNLSLDALADRIGDDRYTSRIASLCLPIELTGKDRRLPQA